jgi:signal transduction histidine kinase
MKIPPILEVNLSIPHGSRPDSGDKVPKAEKTYIHRLLTGMGTAPGAVAPRVYADEHGLPVAYTAVHATEKKVKPDEISVLWHEILSPLTVIKGYVSTLLELDAAISKDQKKQYLQGIESASNRVIRLLENLRDITRLEETDSLIARHVSPVELLRRIVFEVQSQTTKHVIKILPAPRLPLVKLDPEKIEQVLSNLLGNAVKYSPQGGDIEVEVRMIDKEEELSGLYGKTPQMKLPCLIISVADNGVGIPEAELEQIFERFYRVNNKLIRSTPGAGLGLYICRLIVEAHGGRIWAGNRSRGGSIFHFSLPTG